MSTGRFEILNPDQFVLHGPSGSPEDDQGFRLLNKREQFESGSPKRAQRTQSGQPVTASERPKQSYRIRDVDHPKRARADRAAAKRSY